MRDRAWRKAGLLGLLQGVLVALPRLALAQSDPFAPYLDSVPTLKQTLSTQDSGSGATAVTVREITFASRDGQNTVFGVLAAPQAAGTYPGILMLQGGGGAAKFYLPTARSYAQAGYVALAIDVPHICLPQCDAASTGPWRERPATEEPRFDVTGGPDRSVLVDAELAGVEAFNLLRSQPNVDPARVGIFGSSWGGYSTTMVSSLLGARVKAAYAVWGSGFYDLGSFWKERIEALSPEQRATWTMFLDAGRRVPDLRAPYFLDAATNDTYFWPPAVSATLSAAGSSDVNHAFVPNVSHKQAAGGAAMMRRFMDFHLKGQGTPFAKARISAIHRDPDGRQRIEMALDLPEGVTVAQANLYYSEANTDWKARNWQSLEATKVDATHYVATLTPALAARAMDFYGHFTDQSMAVVSTRMLGTSAIVPPLGGAGGVAGGSGASGSSSGSGGTSSPEGGGAGATSGGGGAPAPTGGTGGVAGNAGSQSASGGTSGAVIASEDNGCACQARAPRWAGTWTWLLGGGALAVGWSRRRAADRRAARRAGAPT